MKKIFIGVTALNSSISINMSRSQSVTLIANAYLDILNDYHCVPIILPSMCNEQQIMSYITVLDGLILTSGQDLSPDTYGIQGNVKYSNENMGIGDPYMRPIMLAPDKIRDTTEILFYKQAKEKGIPIIGICRGMQLINVAEGGTLYEEIPETTISHFVESDGWINYHSIDIVSETLCSRLLGMSKYFVSSIHHQCINKIGDELQVSAFSEDGVIEIIEHLDNNKFIIGIQGHIEKTRKNQKAFEIIFKEFFNQSRVVKEGNASI